MNVISKTIRKFEIESVLFENANIEIYGSLFEKFTKVIMLIVKIAILIVKIVKTGLSEIIKFIWKNN